MPPPTTTASDLIFSEQANHNFSKTLGDIKRHTLSIHNRLQSVLTDAAFVQSVAEAYGRPLIANERCGSWYIDPETKAGSAYFKSTDGHTGVWKFSTRRLNTHLLKQIGQHDGCIIVDSTRRGKRVPDALSKTIPIWCSVINRALFPDNPEFHNLHTPPHVVSSSEHAQISARLPAFAASFSALALDLATLRSHISKPLRPMWVTPDSAITAAAQVFGDSHPVICCTASRRVAGAEASEEGYIQGSGDDTENWAHGLTPALFWPNRALLLDTAEPELPSLITDLVARAAAAQCAAGTLAPLPPTASLYVVAAATLAAQPPAERGIVVALSPGVTDAAGWQTAPDALDAGVGAGKIGSRNLRGALRGIVEFVRARCAARAGAAAPPLRIMVACPEGRDLAVGVALALLCLLYDEKGELVVEAGGGGGGDIDKTYVRRRLGWIMTAMPEANPSRATLQSVNSFLMERPS